MRKYANVKMWKLVLWNLISASPHWYFYIQINILYDAGQGDFPLTPFAVSLPEFPAMANANQWPKQRLRPQTDQAP
jgi:hypothetical protein